MGTWVSTGRTGVGPGVASGVGSGVGSAVSRRRAAASWSPAAPPTTTRSPERPSAAANWVRVPKSTTRRPVGAERPVELAGRGQPRDREAGIDEHARRAADLSPRSVAARTLPSGACSTAAAVASSTSNGSRRTPPASPKPASAAPVVPSRRTTHAHLPTASRASVASPPTSNLPSGVTSRSRETATQPIPRCGRRTRGRRHSLPARRAGSCGRSACGAPGAGHMSRRRRQYSL